MKDEKASREERRRGRERGYLIEEIKRGAEDTFRPRIISGAFSFRFSVSSKDRVAFTGN
jgi:hypothetical protein